MRILKGKIAIRFTKELIKKFERDKPADLSWGRIIVQDRKSFEITVEVSVEIGIVEAVNPKQTFYKPGDRVLLSYLVFYDGRGKYGRDTPIRRFQVCENGDEIFYAYDSTSEWDNATEIYAKITEDGLEIHPGLIMINEPRKKEKLGRFYLPKEYQTEEREEPFYATVLNIHPETAKHNGIATGDEILCYGGLSYEVKTGKDAQGNEQSFYFIRQEYLLGRVNKKINAFLI